MIHRQKSSESGNKYSEIHLTLLSNIQWNGFSTTFNSPKVVIKPHEATCYNNDEGTHICPRVSGGYTYTFLGIHIEKIANSLICDAYYSYVFTYYNDGEQRYEEKFYRRRTTINEGNISVAGEVEIDVSAIVSDNLQKTCTLVGGIPLDLKVFDKFEFYYSPVIKADLNGQPNFVIKYALEAGKPHLITQTIPAWQKYTEMKTPNMLAQSCGSIAYSATGPIGNPAGLTLTPINATATRWSPANNTFIPIAQYAWKADLDNGLPTSTFSEFIYTPDSYNDAWLISDSISRVNSLNQPVETVKRASDLRKVYNTSVLGHTYKMAVAGIANANFKESGVFTCDYDLNETASNDGSLCFDLENGWKKGTAGISLPNPAVTMITDSAKHFGEKGLKATNSFGAVRVFKLEKDKDYVLSAWVKPVVNGTAAPQTVPVTKGMVMNVLYRKSPDNGTTWPLQVYLNEGSTPEINSGGTMKPSEQYGDWYYVELPVPASKDLKNHWDNGYEYAAAWVGCPHGNGNGQSATVYIDDIRFYPKGALVTSTYYDQKWYQPRLSIDANSKPGKRITYDEFGRSKLWEKLDLTKATTHAEYAKKVMEKEYHLMGVAE